MSHFTLKQPSLIKSETQRVMIFPVDGTIFYVKALLISDSEKFAFAFGT